MTHTLPQKFDALLSVTATICTAVNDFTDENVYMTVEQYSGGPIWEFGFVDRTREKEACITAEVVESEEVGKRAGEEWRARRCLVGAEAVESMWSSN
jgi:hypothetical protein